MADDVTIIEVRAFPQEMRHDSERLDEFWVSFFSQLEWPIRIISMTQRFDLRGPQDNVDRLLRPLDERAKAFAPIAQAVAAWDGRNTYTRLQEMIRELNPLLQQELRNAIGPELVNDQATWQRALDKVSQPLWRRRWLKEYRQMYENLSNQISLRGLHHYMLAWLPEGVRADDQIMTIQQTFETPANIAALPSFLQCPYVEGFDYLEPSDPAYPYLCFLVSYDMKGLWDTTFLHRVLDADMDVALCIDVSVMSRTRAEIMADFAVTSKQNQLRDNKGPRDVKAERMLQAAMQVQELLDSQAIHDTRIIIAVTGNDLDELNQNARQVRQILGSRLKVLRPPGGQGPLAQYFTSSASSKIDAYAPTRRVPSHGVSVMMPFGLRKPDRTDGILWMIQGDTPIMFDPFADRRAAHAVVLGKTGYGKTFASNVLGMRLLSQGFQVVVYEPQGHSRRLVAGAAPGGARYVLDLHQRVNVLDVIATRDEQGRPPSVGTQVAHVASQLAVLLGTTRITGDGQQHFESRLWTSIERGLLDVALQNLYAPYNLDSLQSHQTPILSDLCDALTDLGEIEAKGLAREVNIRLVKGSLSETFNARTTIDWDFTHDVTAYDFSAIPDGELRTFYYGQAFGALNRAIRSPQRNRQRTMVAMIDEFWYMARVPVLASFAAMATKTWRTFGAHLWTMDQDAHTFLGAENVGADGSMTSIFTNSPLKIIFRQDADPARRLAKAIEGLQPGHIERITRLGRGECIIIWESDAGNGSSNEVYAGTLWATDAELRAFSGT